MHRFVGTALVFPAAALVIAACGSSGPSSSSEQPLADASPGDGSRDDGARAPSLVPDGSVLDAGPPPDAAVLDAAIYDARASEAGPTDAAGADALASDASTTRAPDAAAAAGDAAAPNMPLDDPQIVGILEGANTGEILESLLASGNPDDAVDLGLEAGVPRGFDAGGARSTNPNVLGYANMMMIDDAQSNSTLDSLGIAPTQSRMLSTVQSDAQGSMARLTPLTGSAFDLAYAQDHVASQTRLRNLVRDQLAPAARDTNLQMYLNGTLLPIIDVHLLAANALVAQLVDGGLPTPPAPPPGM